MIPPDGVLWYIYSQYKNVVQVNVYKGGYIMEVIEFESSDVWPYLNRWWPDAVEYSEWRRKQCQ